MEHFGEGGPDATIDVGRAGELLDDMLARLKPLNRVLLVPPDVTRFHSWAGTLTGLLWQRLQDGPFVAVMPAIGTHTPVSAAEIERMFPSVPADRFLVHDWRNSLVRLGEVPADFVAEVSEGRLRFPIAVEVSRALFEGRWDAIFSIGQLVPHEVAGIANHNKNVLVGCGGSDFINKSHYLGAVYGMERMMGRAKTPVRDVFNYAEQTFLRDLPLHYILTVRERTADGAIVTRGLFAGDDDACFLRGAELCRKVNLNLLDRAPAKAVVYLEPDGFRSTWLGNKSVYRTRMAIADGGELLVLAPGVKEFGEDAAIDRLIRKFGYRGTPSTLESVAHNPELAANLSAAAHMIHGSSEGRFTITYCPGKLTQKETESVGYQYGDLNTALQKYDHKALRDGWNESRDGEEFFFVSNPRLGLWGVAERF
jgi:nickel-dependent lactate racemase